MQFTSLAELFQHSKGIGQRFHLLKWLSQRANFKGTERSQLGEFPGSLENLLSGVGRDKFERAVFDQHYAEILPGWPGAVDHQCHRRRVRGSPRVDIYISISCAVKDIS